VDAATYFRFQPEDLKILTLALEAWDRCVQARESLAEHGTTFVDRFGQPRARPEVAIERDSRLAFLRLMRALDFDERHRPTALSHPYAAQNDKSRFLAGG
jgi:phage terminase small subunit